MGMIQFNKISIDSEFVRPSGLYKWILQSYILIRAQVHYATGTYPALE